ncbi:MAG: hypothetical protein ACI9KE_001792 [Polyangiales bacterium]|jgi:hypothetical protein
MSWWRCALLLCLGCSFDPAALEGRPGPCIDGYTEVDGFCFLRDAGAPDGVTPDARDAGVDTLVDAALDALESCRCEGTVLLGCNPCEGGEHHYCSDGMVSTGSSCLNDVTVATCEGDQEIFGVCVSGCADTNGWGCDFAPALLEEDDMSGSLIQGDALVIDTQRGTLELDGRRLMGTVRVLDSQVVVYVSVLDVQTIQVDGDQGVAIRASDTIRIRQGIDVSAVGPVPGPGGFEMSDAGPCGDGAMGGGVGGGGVANLVGGGGGGFGTAGGSGGSEDLCVGSGAAGEAHAFSFVGGSAGGGSDDARGGGGGGALYLSARVAIFADGIIDASGGGGRGATRVSGAGGGAGGLIYLESPIFVAANLALRATGGGGGGTGRSGRQVDGEDGIDGVVAAAGGIGDVVGGAGSNEDGEAGDGDASVPGQGGGAGGGAGHIIIRTGEGELLDGVQTVPNFDSPSVRWERLP